MAYLLKGGTVITLDPAVVERTDLRVDAGVIVDRGDGLEPKPGDELVRVDGKVLMPGMVCAHTHLYSALARGMPAPSRSPSNFLEILELVWWPLDRALDREMIYCSALVAALEAARCGTTCLFDHHSSPAWTRGSLDVIREAVEAVGLRAVLCYEITDRNCAKARDEAIEETRSTLALLRNEEEPNGAGRSDGTSSLFRAMVGAHASFTLSDSTLHTCSDLMREYGAGLHIHVAEDMCDVEDARSKYNATIIERLKGHDALNDRTILAHGTHLDATSIRLAREAGAWFAHNPRSNMNNRVGYAPVWEFGDRVVMGTDGIGSDMFEEARFAFFKGRDARAGLEAEFWLRTLANNQRLASKAFGIKIGSLTAGSAADLIVMGYDPPTPITRENLAWHFVFGVNSTAVDSVMVKGRFVIRDRRSGLDEPGIYSRARAAAERLWSRLRDT